MRVIGSGTAIASQVFGRGDLLRLLQAIERSTTAALAAGDGDGYTEGYRDGHQAALGDVALAVGIARREVYYDNGNFSTRLE